MEGKIIYQLVGCRPVSNSLTDFYLQCIGILSWRQLTSDSEARVPPHSLLPYIIFLYSSICFIVKKIFVYFMYEGTYVKPSSIKKEIIFNMVFENLYESTFHSIDKYICVVTKTRLVFFFNNLPQSSSHNNLLWHWGALPCSCTVACTCFHLQFSNVYLLINNTRLFIR